jgi:prepilin-type N-terminal cleavage/methylation domain-containing protein
MMARPGSRSAGFTLLEVLVAVAIMGLAGAGALKLIIQSEQALAEARQQRLFVEEVSRLRLELLYEKAPDSGSSGDLAWEVRNQSLPVLDNRWSLRYRSLSVKSKSRSIELSLP